MMQEKLNVLLENGIIDEAIFNRMNEVIDYLLEQNVIDDEDEADTFITHLAMATAREKNDEEQLDFVDESIKKEIEAAKEYDEAVQLWGELSKMVGVDFPEAENDYFYLHLVTLLQAED